MRIHRNHVSKIKERSPKRNYFLLSQKYARIIRSSLKNEAPGAMRDIRHHFYHRILKHKRDYREQSRGGARGGRGCSPLSGSGGPRGGGRFAFRGILNEKLCFYALKDTLFSLR